MEPSPATIASILELAVARRTDLHTAPTIAHLPDIQNALASLPKSLPASGLGTEDAVKYVRKNITPGLAAGHTGPR